MSDREPLSVTVITENEERDLDRCLASVAWADEILVVDSGSTDGTLAVAARHETRVLARAWTGYVDQKNFAADHAEHGWLLSLDADEWVPPECGAEIRARLRSPDADAYAFRRETAFSGSFVRTWSPDWQVRLYRKDRARFAGGRVHESLRPEPGARVARLTHPIRHLAYRSIRDYVDRMNRYTDLAAATLDDRGRRVPWLRMLVSPPATFLKLFVLRGGFLDGTRGLVISAGSAFSTLLKYAKLWERSRETGKRFARDVSPTADDPAPGAVPRDERQR